jgi:hypothetical protein
MTTHEARFFEEDDKKYDRKKEAKKRHKNIKSDKWVVKPLIPLCSETYNGNDKTDKESELDYFFKTYGHPANWAIVLKHFPKLHLCLAHFGGDFEWGHEPMVKWASDKSKEMPKREWISSIIYLINYYDNVYTDISCLNIFDENIKAALKHTLSLINDPTSQKIKIKFLREQISKLIYNNDGQKDTQNSTDDENLINPFERLKDKLIFGSDWYLTHLTPIAKNAKYSNYCLAFRNLFDEVDKSGELWERVSLINPWKCYSLSLKKIRNMHSVLPGLSNRTDVKYYDNVAKDTLKSLEYLYCNHIKKKLIPQKPCEEESTCKKELKPCKKT